MFKKLIWVLKLENFKNMILRFPVSFTMVLWITLLLFIYVKTWYPWSGYENILLKSTLTFSLMFFLSLGLYLACEDTKLTDNKKALFQVLPLLFWALFYYFFDMDFRYYNNVIFYILSLTGISAFVFFAPFIKNFKKACDNNLYYQYFYRMAIVFLFGFFVGWLMFLLGFIAIISVQLLFDISINDTISNWAVISLAFITPVMCLMQIPEDNQKLSKNFSINNFSSLIIKYILTPAVFIYFLILYAYSIKVLMNFNDWPRQEVSSLVIAFTIVWYITYLLTYYFENIKLISRLRKAFPFVVVPQLFMLFYAIYLRIAQYDLTVNRYFVVVFGLWLLIISLYLIFSKKKSLISITSVLTLFTIIISIWPWSVFSLPWERQLNRLETNLKQAWILVDWEIIPLNDYSDIDANLSKQIYDGMTYVCNSVDCDILEKMFPEQVKSQKNNWYIIWSIAEQIKVRSYRPINTESTEYVYGNINGSIYPISLDWYDYIVEVSRKYEYDFDLTDSIYKNLTLIINTDMDYLSIVEDNKILEKISILELKKSLYDMYTIDKITEFTKDELTYDLEWEKYNIRLFIYNFSFNIKEKELEKFNYIDAYWLIKEK